MEDCIFCKIVNGQIPSEKIFENEDLVAIRDIHPVAPTHILVLTKSHISTLNDIKNLSDKVVASLLKSAPQIARMEGIENDGYRVIINCNKNAGQEIFHLHMHILGGRKLGSMG